MKEKYLFTFDELVIMLRNIEGSQYALISPFYDPEEWLKNYLSSKEKIT